MDGAARLVGVPRPQALTDSTSSRKNAALALLGLVLLLTVGTFTEGWGGGFTL